MSIRDDVNVCLLENKEGGKGFGIFVRYLSSFALFALSDIAVVVVDFEISLLA